MRRCGSVNVEEYFDGYSRELAAFCGSQHLCADEVSSRLKHLFGHELMGQICENLEEECLDSEFLLQQDEASLNRLFESCSFESIAIICSVIRSWAEQRDFRLHMSGKVTSSAAAAPAITGKSVPSDASSSSLDFSAPNNYGQLIVLGHSETLPSRKSEQRVSDGACNRVFVLKRDDNSSRDVDRFQIGRSEKADFQVRLADVARMRQIWLSSLAQEGNMHHFNSYSVFSLCVALTYTYSHTTIIHMLNHSIIDNHSGTRTPPRC